MPTLQKLTRTRNGRRVEFYRGQIRRVGHKALSINFAEGTKKADAWEKLLHEEQQIQQGNVPTLQHKQWKEYTLKKLIEDYHTYMGTYLNVWKRKKTYESERADLQNFINNEGYWLARKPILTLKTQDIQEHFDHILHERGILSSSLRRNYITPLRSIWNKYGRQFRKIPLADIFQGLTLPANPPHRRRILLPEDRPRLFKAIEGCRGIKQQELWLSLVLAALNTGLPRAALLRLQWKHVDFDKRNIFAVPVKKQEEGRWLPMTGFLCGHLQFYHDTLSMEERAPISRVFPITGTAHEQAWKRIVKRANPPLSEIKEDGTIEYLHFHDLRHTALTDFGTKNPERLDVRESAYMKGTKYGGTLQLYEQIELIEDIRKKLVAKENAFLETCDDLPAHMIASYRAQGLQNKSPEYPALWQWEQ